MLTMTVTAGNFDGIVLFLAHRTRQHFPDGCGALRITTRQTGRSTASRLPAVDQVAQLYEILETKGGSPRRHDDPGVGLNEVGPGGPNSPELSPFIEEVCPGVAPGASTLDQFELAAVERMEGVSHPKGPGYSLQHGGSA